MFEVMDASSATQTLLVLGELSIKGGVVLAIAALIAFMLRRSPAADRHLVWFAALAGIVLLPAVSAVLPSWHALEAPTWLRAAAPSTTVALPERPSDSAVGSDVISRTAPLLPDSPDRAPDAAYGAVPTSDEATIVEQSANPVILWLRQIASGIYDMHWSVLLFWVWIVGAGLILTNLVLGAMQLIHVTGRSRPVRGAEWANLADEIGDRLFLTREVLILKGSSTRMPMTWGGLRPVVLLPSDADSWTGERKRCVLSHEFAHIKRWDTTTQGVAQLACSVFWFNPLVWYAAARLRTEREKACDETVVQLGTRPSAYADHLLDLARSVERSALHPLGAVAMAKPTQLEGRVLSILRNRPHGFSAGRSVRILTAIAAVSLFIPLAALSPAINPGPAGAGVEYVDDATAPVAADMDHPAAAVPAADPADAVAAASEAVPAMQEAPADTIDGQRERLAAVFIEALRDDDPEIRRNAAHMLGDLEIDSAIEALGETLARDEVEDVRRSAAWAIGEIGGREGAAYLVAGLDDTSADVRRYVIHALEDLDYSAALPEVLARFESETDAEVLSAMVWILGEFEDEGAVDPLLRAWDSAEDADLRRQIVWALTEIESPRAVPVFEEAIRDENSDVRSMAVRGLGEIEHPAALEALVEALGDENEDVRSMAVWALGELGDERSVDALTALMQDDSREVRRRVIWALQEIESPRSLDTFLAATRDEDPEIRRHAVLGLNELEDPRSVDRLIELLGDENEDVRTMAVHTLGEIEDDRATGPLVELLDDSSSKVRRAAVHALSEFESEESRRALISAVKSDDREVRMGAVTALSEFEDAESVRALESVLTGDSDAEIRKRAARMLMHIESDEALDALDRALEAGGDVREAVMQALGRR